MEKVDGEGTLFVVEQSYEMTITWIVERLCNLGCKRQLRLICK
jgi:hypothetical protein